MLPTPRLLVAARILANVTQAELAERAGLSVSAVRRLEVGATDARIKTVEALTVALVKSGIEFLYDSETMKEGIRHRRPEPSRVAKTQMDGEKEKRRRVGAARKPKTRTFEDG